MAYSDNFPAVRPVFQADFANGGRIDPRASYTRSTTGSFYGKDKHLSSENLLLQSSDFDTTWSKQGLEVPTGGQADPAGGTDGFTLEETSGANFHHIWQSPSVTGSLALTVYAKQNSGTRYVYLTIWNAVNDWQIALFDLAGGAPATSNGSASTFTGVTATQTASGGGYYKCTLKATGTASVTYIGMDDSSTVTGYSTGYGVKSYTGDGTSSLNIAFSSLTTTGASDYQSTTTQIHREYAPTLQTAAINAARFEHSATDGQSGAKGLLIEGQVQNLFGYTEDFTQSDWTPTTSAITTGAAVAPSGDLTANLVVPNSGASFGQFYQTETLNSGTVYTLSFFAKNAGWGSGISLFFGTTGPWGSTGDQRYAQFNLSTGEAVLESGGVTGSSEDVGNGWRRYSVTTPATTVTTSAFPGLAVTNLSGSSITGDGYSGVMVWGAQLVPLSFSGSYVGSSSSSGATKALDSLSMASSSLFDNGGGTLYAEASQNVLDTYNGVFAVSDGTGANTIEILGNSSSFRGQVVNANSTNASFIGGTITVGQFNKHALTFSSSEASYYVNGSEIGTTDSSVVVPTVSEIDIGNVAWSRPLNGHIRKVALYAEPISETAAAALTS